MSFTECPHCHRIAKDHGSVISKEIGSPLVTCKNCKRLIADNNIYEWGVIPIESRLNYCLFANYRFAVHWLALLLPLSVMVNDSFLLGLLLAIIVEAVLCPVLYFCVVEQNSAKIKESINRAKDINYIGRLIEFDYDKLDAKLYDEYLESAHRKSEPSTSNASPTPAQHDQTVSSESEPSPTSYTSSNLQHRSVESAPMPPKKESIVSENYQIALDRWKTRKKSDWDVGVEYERYIGYLLECEGYKVHYSGAILGINDGGRDLIAIKKKKALVIQCKRWSKEKIIHEKHIHQLHGSTSVLSAKNPGMAYKAVFITTTVLSDAAKKDAETCNVSVVEQFPMSEYPLIKCNANTKGQKIYHLPFDPQYDVIIISKNKESCYAWTIAEAEAMGFRHSNQKKIKEVHTPKQQLNNEKKQSYRAQNTIYSPAFSKSMSSPPHATSNSSLIRKIEYKDNFLFLTFTTGHSYCYCNVPETVYKEMIAAPSKGRFFHDRIEGKYPYC